MMTTNHRMLPALTIAGLAVSALLLTGCTAGGGTKHVPPTPHPSSTAGTADGASTTKEFVYPLDAYMSSVTGISNDFAEAQEQIYQLDKKREVLVAACMKSAGFRYTPDAVKNTATTGQIGPSDSDRESPAWVAKYGYGAVFTPEGATGRLDLDRQHPTHGGTTNPPMSANGKYVSSLPDAEQQAYYVALFGDTTDSSLTIASDWKRLGCDGAALHAIKTPSAIMHSPEGEAVDKAIADFDAQWLTWPGIAEVQKAWSSCMTSAGYAGYRNQSRPETEILTANSTLWEAGTASPPSDAQLSELARKEVAVATADLKCRTTTKYRSTVRDITVAQQKQFIADHKAALDALQAAALRSAHK